MSKEAKIKLDIPLKKPVVFVKVHTTGLDPKKDRIIQISLHKYGTDGSFVSGTKLINPETHIPEEATAISGITNEKVDGKPVFSEVGKGLFDFINDCDVIGFNVKFDLAFLASEFGRMNLTYSVYNKNVLDLYELYCFHNPRNFLSAVKLYVNNDVESNDILGADKYASLSTELFKRLFSETELSMTDTPLNGLDDIIEKTTGGKILDIDGWFKLQDGKPVFNKGQHRGVEVSVVLEKNEDYFNWLLHKADGITQDTKSLIEKMLKKAKKEKIQ